MTQPTVRGFLAWSPSEATHLQDVHAQCDDIGCCGTCDRRLPCASRERHQADFDQAGKVVDDVQAGGSAQRAEALQGNGDAGLGFQSLQCGRKGSLYRLHCQVCVMCQKSW